LTAALLNQELRDNLNAAAPTGSLHYYIRAATTSETLINAFALEGNGVTPLRATYGALNTVLSALSYPFGSGNGTTTFTLPDIQNRGLVAQGSGGHADSNALGDSDGVSKGSRAQKETVSVSGSISGSGDSSGLSITGTPGSSSTGFAAGGQGPGLTAVTAGSLDVAGTSTVTGSFSGSGALVGAYLVAGVWAVKI
jgi:microcystin-dependent protein